MRVSHIGAPHLGQNGRTVVFSGLSAKWSITLSTVRGPDIKLSDSNQVAIESSQISFLCFEKKSNLSNGCMGSNNLAK
jgi:hypothetical protein